MRQGSNAVNHGRFPQTGNGPFAGLDAEARSSGIDVAPLARAEKKTAEYQEPGSDSSCIRRSSSLRVGRVRGPRRRCLRQSPLTHPAEVITLIARHCARRITVIVCTFSSAPLRLCVEIDKFQRPRPLPTACVLERGSAIHNFRRPTSVDASRCASIQPMPRP